MKLLFQILTVAVAAFLFPACATNTSNQNEAESDASANASEQVAPAVPVFTEQGIAPVLIGTDADVLPESVEGLYASKKYIQFEGSDEEELAMDDIDGWYFYDKDGKKLFVAETIEKDGKNIIYSVTVYSPDFKTQQGAHVGMSRQKLAAIDGAKYIAPDPEADYEIYMFELGNITITMDYENKFATDMRAFDNSYIDY
jgi:hypothetical protein